MENTKNFSTSVFGGFKKEAVTEYVDSLITDYDSKIADLTEQLTQKDKEIVELKDIIEKQYAKIMLETSAKEEAQEKVKESEETINKLQEKLDPYLKAGVEADFIIKNIQKESDEISARLKNQIEAATKQARQIIADAKSEAEEISRKAREKEKKEREDLVECQKTIETQKARILVSLEEIKNAVRCLKISGAKAENDGFHTMRQNATDSLRKKIISFNKDNNN